MDTISVAAKKFTTTSLFPFHIPWTFKMEAEISPKDIAIISNTVLIFIHPFDKKKLSIICSAGLNLS